MKTPLILTIAAGFLAASPALIHADSTGSADGTAASDLSQYKTADDLWAHIQEMKKGPAVKPASKEDYAAFFRKLDAATQQFFKSYSSDPRKWEAKMLHSQIVGLLAQLGVQGTAASAKEEMESVSKEVMAAPDAPAAIKRDARFVLLQIECSRDGVTPAVEKDIDAFRHDYPGDPGGDSLKFYFAKKTQLTDPAKAQAIFQELANSPNEQVATQAGAALKLADLMKKPLDLKYTAIDGSEVDLAKMRGKVVLVDFWATWCGPCMGEVPNVVAAYKKYHDKGFEIVGISLDQDKDAVLKITREKGMTWQQYFDGKGWQNSISTSFGINSIPAMWLVNKKGIIATTDARENLEAGIEKLLAE